MSLQEQKVFEEIKLYGTDKTDQELVKIILKHKGDVDLIYGEIYE